MKNFIENFIENFIHIKFVCKGSAGQKDWA